MRERYSTKFSKLTLAIGKEPEDYIQEKLDMKWIPMQIYHDLFRIAREFKLPMVSERSIYNWIDRINGNE